MKLKPLLKTSQLWYLSMGFLGIQGGFALQNGNASRILANFGASVEELSWFWLVAPFTGLIVQPIIGYYSDKTWGRWGRRKPYFFVGAILAVLGLLLLPNANSIVAGSAYTLVFAGTFLAFMDASFNVAMEPFRALVADMLPKNQTTKGFAIQTVLIGIGAVVGSWLPTFLHKIMHIPNVAAEGSVPDNVKFSFYIGAVLLLTTILVTLFKTKEYSPEEMESFGEREETSKSEVWITDIFKDFKNMPERMKRLGAVQFFSWFGLFTMWVYTTSAVATHHYGALPTDTHSALFNDAGDWVGILFGIYNGISAIYALFLHKFVNKTSRKFVHIFSLVCGGLGLISMKFILDPTFLIIPMIGVGLAWGSILSIPYTLLAEKLPAAKMGVYMGIFNFFIVVPQILSGIVGGPIVKNVFNSYAINYVMVGGVFFLIAAALTLKVQEPLWNEFKDENV
ncbi:MAG: MFS transporter [Bacteroidia bacterium]